MPINQKKMNALIEQYGEKKGRRIYFAMENIERMKGGLSAMTEKQEGALGEEWAKAVFTRKSPPKGYPKSKALYADPANWKYPIDTKKHVRAAIAYFSKAKNRAGYTQAQQDRIWGRIRAAAKKFGIEMEE